MLELTDKLNLLDELYCQRDALKVQQQEVIDTILTPEVKAKLVEIETEFAPLQEGVSQHIAELEAEIKATIIANGASTKGAHLMGVFNKGRVSWNTKLLDGYLLAHPEIASARTVGEPYVTFRKV